MAKHLLVFFILLCLITSNAKILEASEYKLKTDSLLVLLQKSNGIKRCEILNSLSSSYSLQDPAKSETFAIEALKQAEVLKDSLQIIKSKISLALALRYQRKFQEVLDILNPTLSYIDRVKDKNLVAEIFNNIGVAHFQLGHNNQSLGRFFESLKLKEELSDQKGMSSVLNNIGNYYFKNKNYDKALEFYTKCMILDSVVNDNRGLAISYYNIGKIYQTKGAFVEAKNFYHLSAEVSKKASNPFGKVIIYSSLAEVYNILNMPDSALQYLAKSDSLNLSLNLIDAKSSNYFLKGQVYKKKNERKLAILNLLSATELFIVQKEYIKAVEGYTLVGNIYLESQQNDKALVFFIKAAEICDTQKFVWLKGEALIGKARAYREMGNVAKSELELWEYVSIRDSISAHNRKEINNDLEYQKGTAELEKKIEGLQKDTRIQNLVLEKEQTKKRNLIILISILIPLLSWVVFLYYERKKTARFLAEKNDQINQQNEELNAINDQLNVSRKKLVKLNQTKDKFFSIVAHDLKSPLVSLRNYLYAIRVTPFENQESFKNQVHDIENSLNTILDLLNNLLFWALSQEDKIDFSPETFNLFEIIEPEIELAKYLGKEKGIRIEHNLPCCEEIVTDKNMLLFILRNLTSNALRYTQENGTIKILYEKIDRTHILRVADNGTGIEYAQQESLFDLEKKISRKEKGTGLGLMLCKEFAVSMGGDIKVESEVGKGATFIVSFPDFSS